MQTSRMLDQTRVPTQEEIGHHIGPAACQCLAQLEGLLGSCYDLSKELRFPFGKEYGWGYKYSHGSKHLCYLFFEGGGLCAMLQIGGGQRVQAIFDQLSSYAAGLWAGRYPCGSKGGGWIHYQISDPAQLEEVGLLIQAKVPVPKRKSAGKEK